MASALDAAKDELPASTSVVAPLKVLTVGDGDLTLSLALSRAYGGSSSNNTATQQQLDLTATTLCSSYEELCDTYSNSAAVVQELVEERHATVIYGVDATQLSSSARLRQKQFDLVLFHHPHLGLMTSKNSTDEAYHAQRHFVLLAHYLASAKLLLQSSDSEEDLLDPSTTSATVAGAVEKDDTKYSSNRRHYYDGRIHLCLAHDQPQTWQMEKAAKMQSLHLVHTDDTNSPFHTIVRQLQLSGGMIDNHRTYNSSGNIEKTSSKNDGNTIHLSPLPPEPGHAAPRRFRNGKLGSKHWLGRYGYQHRRTHGKKFDGGACDMNVEGSKHYFFAPQENGESDRDPGNNESFISKLTASIECSICGLSFESQAALRRHTKAPALPDPPVVENEATAEALGPATKRARQDNPLDPATAPSQPNTPIPEQESQPQSTTDTNGTRIEGTVHRTPSSSSSKPMRWTVALESQGKRLRRFLQHTAFPKRSKKQCDRLVSDGQILVNGIVACDTSRVLNEGDTVSCPVAEENVTSTLQAMEHKSDEAKLEVIASYANPLKGEGNKGSAPIPSKDYLVIVNKPVGMRTKGDYELARSAENILSWQMTKGKLKYRSLSSIDTGCGGLCVLQRQTPKVRGENEEAPVEADVKVTHEFTILVHGHVPAAWEEGVSAEVPWKSVRSWGRQTENLSTGHNENEDSVDAMDRIEENQSVVNDASSKKSDDKTWMMNVKCTERTSLKRRSIDEKPGPALSTLTVSTDCSASGVCRAIILYLRKEHYPVVGDRLCQREYQQLPRSIRNRIKKKLCFGCFRVDIQVGTNTDDATFGISAVGTNSYKDPTNNGEAEGTAVAGDGKRVQNSRTCLVNIPERLKATYWQQHWENATVIAARK